MSFHLMKMEAEYSSETLYSLLSIAGATKQKTIFRTNVMTAGPSGCEV
jgi:hypothetical protein